MRFAFDTETVRAVEAELLDQQRRPDELMGLAARAVAATAEVLATSQNTKGIHILVGPGGNGGDGLFAGALLALNGYSITALLATPKHHEDGLAAFQAAGGKLTEEAELNDETAVLIDAVAGLGGARGLEGTAWETYQQARKQQVPILAVDLPTGIDADTGEADDTAVFATATITFGYARAGHLFAPECGQVIVADLKLPTNPKSFAEALEAHEPAGRIAYEEAIEPPYAWSEHPVLDSPEGYVSALRPVGGVGAITDPVPGIYSDKYSGGVVGLCAGSKVYPGAGILSARAAVRATPSMVRFIGDDSITHHLPEIVVHPSVAEAGRVQAWVFGPGRGTDDNAKAELAELLKRPEPVLIDADGITVLANHADLREAVRKHPAVVLTPHGGEFTRLYEAGIGKQPGPRATALPELAAKLQCVILLKGRITTIAGPNSVPASVDAGHSFAATPGSGDVLSGICGALLAQLAAHNEPSEADIVDELLRAVSLHAHAAAIAAKTPEGYGICSVAQIADALPTAIARLR